MVQESDIPDNFVWQFRRILNRWDEVRSRYKNKTFSIEIILDELADDERIDACEGSEGTKITMTQHELCFLLNYEHAFSITDATTGYSSMNLSADEFQFVNDDSAYVTFGIMKEYQPDLKYEERFIHFWSNGTFDKNDYAYQSFLDKYNEEFFFMKSTLHDCISYEELLRMVSLVRKFTEADFKKKLAFIVHSGFKVSDFDMLANAIK